MAGLLARLGLAHPLVQAPMAGGPTTPALVAAVCEAGALGSVAGGMLAPGALGEALAAVRARTRRPFAVNLFVGDAPRADAGELARAAAWLAPAHAALGIVPPAVPAGIVPAGPVNGGAAPAGAPVDPLGALVDVLLADPPAAVSFTFGVPDGAVLGALRAAGCYLVGTATTVAEARAWADAGADAVCAQGAEAGGHRGTFLPGDADPGADPDAAAVPLAALVPAVVCAVPLPVIAAGGLMDGGDVARALAFGAQAAQLGTAFLCCPEAGTHPAWRSRVLAAGAGGAAAATRLTRAFTGRPARGLVNAFMDAMRPHERAVPPYPLQGALTATLRQAAAARGDADYLPLWAGQGVARARALPAGDLVARLVDEMAPGGCAPA